MSKQSQRKPQDFTLVMNVGTDWSWLFRLQNSSSLTLVDLTGTVAKLALRLPTRLPSTTPNVNGGFLTRTLRLGTGLTLDSDHSTIRAELSLADLSDLEPGLGSWQLDIVYSDGKEERPGAGKVVVNAGLITND
jgi:hypothetical protein